MEPGETSSRGKVLCFCGQTAKIAKAWTDKNPGRKFFGCGRYKEGKKECRFFEWIDKEEPHGWQKNALLEARNEIRAKNLEISDLKETLKKMTEELKKSSDEDDIISRFLKL